MRDGIGEFVALTPLVLILTFFAAAIGNAIYETANCKSMIFMDYGRHRGIVCVTDPQELDRLRAIIRNSN